MTFLAISSLVSALTIPHAIELGVDRFSAESLIVLSVATLLGFGLTLASIGNPKMPPILLGSLLALFADLYFLQGKIFFPAWVVLWIFLVVGLYLGWNKHHPNILLSLALGGLIFTLTSLRAPALLIQETMRNGQLAPPEESSRRKPPSIIHIILDEHTSFEALRNELNGDQRVDEIARKYRSAGLTLHPNVFSTDSSTQHSLNRLFNRSATADLLRDQGPFSFSLSENQLFQQLSARNYTIEVLQSSYLDICKNISVGRCRFYNRAHHLGRVSRSGRGPRDFLMFWLQALRKDFSSIETPRGLYAFVPVRNWINKQFGSAQFLSRPPAMVGIFQAIASEVAELPRGVAYVAHVMLPHFPYTLHESCKSRPTNEILGPARKQPGWSRLREDRKNLLIKRSYTQYFEQVRCVSEWIDRIMYAVDTNPNLHDSLVIIHGDHGARIIQAAGSRSATSTLSPRMQMDSFSVLFAGRPATTLGNVQSLPAAFYATLQESQTGFTLR